MNHPGGALLGRTMDIEADVPFNIIYQPKGYPGTENLLGGHFHSKYAILGIGFLDRDPYKDGVNEHGLVGVINDFKGFNRYVKSVDPEKTNLSSFHFLNYILGNYKSVDEVIEILPELHMSTHNHLGEKVIAPNFHFMLTDSTQRCIVIEPNKGKLEWYENPYGVMTNPPAFPKHVEKLNDLLDPDQPENFTGAKQLPGGYDPISRFIKAFYLNRMSPTNKDVDQAWSQLYNVLSAMSLPLGFIPDRTQDYYMHTAYVSAYDTESRTLTLKSAHNPQIYRLSLSEIENPDQRQAFHIPKSFHSQSVLKIGDEHV